MTTTNTTRPRLWGEVNLDAIGRNLERIRATVGPDREILAVVKANAYGFGADRVATAAIRRGADRLAVANVAEAVALREASVHAPIHVLGAITEAEADEVMRCDLTTTVHGHRCVPWLEAAARRAGRLAPVHLKVDTGLGRLGCRVEEVPALVARIQASGHLRLEGVQTHFANADVDPAATREQMERFEAALARVHLTGARGVIAHAAASAALFAYPDAHYGMVRPGISLHGIDPGNLAALGIRLEPSFSLHTRIGFVKEVAEGTAVGYGSTWRAARDTRIAVLPIGYHDGYPVALSNRAEVLIRGRRAPVVGRVSMDYVTVDVGGVPGVQPEDVATLIGEDGGDEIRIEDLARIAGTIPYELCCRIGNRVERVYHETRVVREPSSRFKWDRGRATRAG